MGLGNLKKKKESSQKGLAALRNTKTKSKGLAALRDKKTEVKPTSLASLKKKKELASKKISKQDFTRDGIKFSNCRFVPRDIEPICYLGQPGAFWAIDVMNGDAVLTFHNRWGSWVNGGMNKDIALPGYDENSKGGREPNGAWMAAALQSRYLEELKARKLPDLLTLRRQQEEAKKQKEKILQEKEKMDKAKEVSRLNKLQKSKNKSVKLGLLAKKRTA